MADRQRHSGIARDTCSSLTTQSSSRRVHGLSEPMLFGQQTLDVPICASNHSATHLGVAVVGMALSTIRTACRYNVASPDIDGCAWTPQSSYGAIRRRSSDVFSVSPHRFVSCFISGLISATCTTTTRCILPTAGTRGHSTRIATKLSCHMPAGVSYSRQVGSQLVPRTRMTPNAFDTAPWLPGIDLRTKPHQTFLFRPPSQVALAMSRDHPSASRSSCLSSVIFVRP